jgi:hypothetical protein
LTQLRWLITFSALSKLPWNKKSPVKKHTDPKTKKQSGLFQRLLILVLSCILLQACAAIEKPESEKPVAKPSGMTLANYLRKAVNEQYFDLENIYNLPDPGLTDWCHYLLAPEEIKVSLAQGVTAFQGFRSALAIGFEQGCIDVYSSWPCSSLCLPRKNSTAHIAWKPDSPYLLASGQGSREVHIFDLRYCGQVNKLKLKSGIEMLCVSSKGKYMAAVDATRRLYIFTADSSKARVAATLRFKPLALQFTPQSGLLMAADAGGWVTLWDNPHQELADKFIVEGGMFAKARFFRHFVRFSKSSGETKTVNIFAAKVAPQARPPRSFFTLQNRVLYFTSENTRLTRKLIMGPARASAGYCPENGLIRVKDIDRKTRFYDPQSGKLLHADPEEVKDCKPLPMGATWSFTHEQKSYKLADVVYQKGDLRLMCRWLEGKGYFLWWNTAPQERMFDPHPGSLPQRKNILASSAVNWKNLQIKKKQNGQKEQNKDKSQN